VAGKPLRVSGVTTGSWRVVGADGAHPPSSEQLPAAMVVVGHRRLVCQRDLVRRACLVRSRSVFIELSERAAKGPGYTESTIYILSVVTKHLVDIDDDTLGAARAELGTATLKDTVNEALRQAASTRDKRVSRALDRLAAADFGDREDAWR
jgi:Arc/MetJ family transcription regulator